MGDSILIDLGSHNIKAGFTLLDGPRSIFPNITGTKPPRNTFLSSDHYHADSVIPHLNHLHTTLPLSRGLLTSDIEPILNYTFRNEMRVSPSEHPVILALRPKSPKEMVEKLAMILFETFEVPKVHMCSQATLALLGSGRSNGVVVDVGHGVSHAVPFINGKVLPVATQRVHLGGEDVSRSLVDMMTERGIYLQTPFEVYAGGDIKEKLGYVALDYEEEWGNVQEKCYELVNRVILLGSERFRCSEVLFSPELVGFSYPGVHEMTNRAIVGAQSQYHEELYGNVVLCGGSSLFPGMAERMKKELVKLAPKTTKVNIIATPQRKYLVWMGGKVLESMPSFNKSWFDKEEYDEKGPGGIIKKCPGVI